MNGIEWSRNGSVLLGGAIGIILVVPIVIMLNELFYWFQCKRNGWTHEWLVLDDILEWIRK